MEQVADCCILAAVGQQMASRKGVSATMFSALAKANINVRCARLRTNFCFRFLICSACCISSVFWHEGSSFQGSCVCLVGASAFQSEALVCLA